MADNNTKDTSKDQAPEIASDSAASSTTTNKEETPVAPAENKKLDETVPGGRYLVNDVLVDANGKPVK